ncbi:MAG: Riboflavin synthase [Bacteroidota bacterium]
MFTGIIENLGELKSKTVHGTNIDFWFEAPFTNELKIDQSLAHNGICLTVVEIKGNTYRVTAIDETMKRTNLGDLNIGDKVNLERCMSVNARFDGHIVQGHVDGIGICTKIEELDGSWKFHFEYSKNIQEITVEKGSITINGTSLTVVDSGDHTFSVAIIPYTYEHTNFHEFQVGTKVNLEFDIVGKYIRKLVKREE